MTELIKDMMSKAKCILVISFLLLTTLACNTLALPTTSTPLPPMTPTAGNSLLTEANVPRITAEHAKAAVENSAAIIVDVRSKEEYNRSHIAGAVNIRLDEIEANPTGLDLEKDQWIITYCT